MAKHKKRTEQDRPLRIAGYIRVSSQRQASEGDSLIAQRHEIEQEVEIRKRRESWKVAKVGYYTDAGKSAKDQNRPELLRLKGDIEAGQIDVVICMKLDRITRSLADFVELWELFESRGVNVISLREQFDTSTPSGRAMLRMIIVFAELEREMTSERTFDIMKDRVERGLWNGGCIVGYKSDPTEPGKLLVDPEWADIIRRQFFDAFEELGSAGAVQRKLHKLGLRCPVWTSRSGKVRGGKLFTKQQVIAILRSPLYIGRIKWGEAFKDDCHEPLISKEQFERVQRVLGETTKHRRNHRRNSDRCYLLRGLVRCSCGAQMTPAGAHGHGGKYHYYVCTRQVHEGGKVSCQAPRFPAEALEIAILERIRVLAAMEEARERIVQEALKVIAEESTRVRGEEEILRRQLAKVRGDIGQLVGVLKTLGATVLKSVQEELSRLEQEERGLDQQLQEVSERKNPLDQISSQARQFIETWKNVGQLLDQADAEEQRLILQHYVEVIELRATDSKGKVGTYALRLFPEVRPFTCQGDESKKAEGPAAQSPRGGSPLLTSDGQVLETVGKAPREGFEPSTRRLTAGCSTIELSRINTSTYKARPFARQGEYETTSHLFHTSRCPVRIYS